MPLLLKGSASMPSSLVNTAHACIDLTMSWTDVKDPSKQLKGLRLLLAAVMLKRRRLLLAVMQKRLRLLLAALRKRRRLLLAAMRKRRRLLLAVMRKRLAVSF
jgi:hypothetical protein